MRSISCSVRDVVQAQQPSSRRLADLEQVADVAPAVPLTHLAHALGIEWLVGQRVLCVLDVQPAATCERGAVAPDACLHHAVELIHAETDGFHEAGRVAHPHQVARAVGGKVRKRGSESGQHLGPALAHAQTTDAVAVEADLDGVLGALGTQGLVDAALHDAEQGLIGPPVRRFGSGRPQRRAFHCQTHDCSR